MEPGLLVNERQLWRVPGCDLRPVTSLRVCFLICDGGKLNQRARTFHEQLVLGKTCLGVVVHTQNSSAEEGEAGGSPGLARWPASLACLANSRPVRDPASENEVYGS